MTSSRSEGLRAGLTWTASSAVLTLLVQTVFVALSGRLLSPADFGIFAVGSVIVRFGSYLAQAGLGQAVVQRPTLSPEEWGTAISLSAVLGIIAAAVTSVLSGPLSAAFGQPAAQAPAAVLGGSLALIAVSGVFSGRLRREGRFARVAVIEFSSYVIAYGGVGITSMVLGLRVWALVLAAVTQPALMLIQAIALTGGDLRPGWQRQHARSLISFGGKVTVISFGEFIAANTDTWSISRFLGVAAVGQYNRAMSLVNVVVVTASTAISKVLIPTVAHSEIRHGSSLVGRIVGALVFPLSISVAFFAAASHVTFSVVLGTHWGPAASSMPWAVAAGALSVITHFIAVAYEARGVLNEKLIIQFAHLALSLALLPAVALTTRSLVTTAAAFAACEAFRLLVYLLAGRRHVHLPLRDISRELALSAPVAVCAYILIRVFIWLFGLAPAWVLLIGAMSLCLIVLGVSVVVFRTLAFSVFARSFLDKRRRPSAGGQALSPHGQGPLLP